MVIGDAALADTRLAEGATQFIVIEAKLFSSLSPGVTNAGYFDQAARNVACMAQVLFKAQRRPEQLRSLGFFVLAPSEQVKRGIFEGALSKGSIQGKVTQRVKEYPSPDLEKKEEWRRNWFLPTLDRMEIECLSWDAKLCNSRSRRETPPSGQSWASFTPTASDLTASKSRT